MSASNRRVTYIGVANDSFGVQVCGFRFPSSEWVVLDDTGRDYVPTFGVKQVNYKDICATLHTHLSECTVLPISAGVHFPECTWTCAAPIHLSVSVLCACVNRYAHHHRLHQHSSPLLQISSGKMPSHSSRFCGPVACTTVLSKLCFKTKLVQISNIIIISIHEGRIVIYIIISDLFVYFAGSDLWAGRT